MNKKEILDCTQKDDGTSFLIQHENMRTVKFWVFKVERGRKRGALQFGFKVTGMWWCNQLKDVLMHTKETIFIPKEDLPKWSRSMVQYKL